MKISISRAKYSGDYSITRRWSLLALKDRQMPEENRGRLQEQKHRPSPKWAEFLFRPKTQPPMKDMKHKFDFTSVIANSAEITNY